MNFGKDFIWGAATAAYQIEGGVSSDGRGPSIWDVTSRLAGNTFEEQTGDVACDHYHRFREDVALLKKGGIKNYRFSVSWTRIYPQGTGKRNEEGIRFYNDLINELLKNGITPWLTLYHWDYPAALERKGGWLNKESPVWFETYAKTVAELFGDRVKHFFTFNEPQCFIDQGYRLGVKAPFEKRPMAEVLQMAHNVLLANGRAVRAIREITPDAKIGMANTLDAVAPLTKKDEEVARRETFAYTGDLFNAVWWSDPVILGKYPENFLREFEKYGFAPSKEDMELIRCRLDFYAVNLYRAQIVEERDGKTVFVKDSPSVRRNCLKWSVRPECLYYAPKFLYERYRLPVLISENGIALDDWPTDRGRIYDYGRMQYIREHVLAMNKAVGDGVPIVGYFHWSFMDNYEWSEGYVPRFGLVYIDYDTMERIPKQSFYYYRGIVRTNGKASKRKI